MNFSMYIKHLDGKDTNTINLRHLHFRLGSRKDYSTWAKNQIDSLGLKESEDYIIVLPLKGEKRIEYFATIDIAKHIAMTSKTERGRLIRQHFIDLENNLKALEIQKAQIFTKEIRQNVLYNHNLMVNAMIEYYNSTKGPCDNYNLFAQKEVNTIYRIVFENEEIDFVKWFKEVYNTNLKPREYMEENLMDFELWAIDRLERIATNSMNDRILKTDQRRDYLNQVYQENLKNYKVSNNYIKLVQL